MDPLNHYQMGLIWIPNYQDIEGKEKAVVYAVNGTYLDESVACNDVLTF